VLTSFNRTLLELKILFTFVEKQVTLIRRSTVLKIFLQLVFLAFIFFKRKHNEVIDKRYLPSFANDNLLLISGHNGQGME